MSSPTAVLLQTHFFDNTMDRLYHRLRASCPPHYACYVLIHLPPNAVKPDRLRHVPHHFVTTPEIRDPAYPAKSAGGSDWNIWAGGHSDLVWLHFLRSHPEFERVWCIEYDVRFSGPWSRLFTAFEENEADLLTTTLRTAATDPHWIYWPVALMPPDHAALPPETDRIKGFMPVLRVSRAGTKAIDGAYRAGWGGHCEATWPTLIHQAGLRIEDIGDHGPFVRPANRGRFYSNTSLTWNYAPGTFVYKPAKHFVGLRRNRLYHPIKPLQATLREDWGRLQAKLRVTFPGLVSRLPPMLGGRLPRAR